MRQKSLLAGILILALAVLSSCALLPEEETIRTAPVIRSYQSPVYKMAQVEREALLEEWGKASPQSYWLSGQDYLDVGDVETAIICFRIGDVVDPENYDGLLLLANAYQLNMQDQEAETVYLHLVNDVSPFRTDASTRPLASTPKSSALQAR